MRHRLFGISSLVAACAVTVGLAADPAKPAPATNPPPAQASKPIPSAPKGNPGGPTVVLRLQLVWGTDDEKKPEHNFQEIDPGLKDRFLRHLRWKHYYVVKDSVARPLSAQPQRVQLSEKCALEVFDNGKGQASITLLNLRPGQGPSLVKSELVALDEIRGGRAFVYGGDSKDRWDDSWLAIVTAAR
jgi:hypothetical protein